MNHRTNRSSWPELHPEIDAFTLFARCEACDGKGKIQKDAYSALACSTCPSMKGYTKKTFATLAELHAHVAKLGG